MSDLIERAEAIKALYKYSFVSKDVIEREIKAIPSADTDLGEYSDKLWKSAYERGKADRPQGEWIYTNNPLRLDDEWACNRCGNISFVKTNFCDRCGARMKGADDE